MILPQSGAHTRSRSQKQPRSRWAVTRYVRLFLCGCRASRRSSSCSAQSNQSKCAAVTAGLKQLRSGVLFTHLVLEWLAAAAAAAGRRCAFSWRQWLLAASTGRAVVPDAHVSIASGQLGLVDEVLAAFARSVLRGVALLDTSVARALGEELLESGRRSDAVDAAEPFLAALVDALEGGGEQEVGGSGSGSADGAVAMVAHDGAAIGSAPVAAAARRGHRQSVGAFVAAQASTAQGALQSQRLSLPVQALPC
jgi:hypothetical protein